MKQIFDWLREQMRNKAYKAWDGDNKREIMLITLPVVENIINEAEAKWEAECCEWKRVGLTENPRYVSAHDLWELLTDAELWQFCPYCGKSIKISEVE